jgi:hypothetical protein
MATTAVPPAIAAALVLRNFLRVVGDLPTSALILLDIWSLPLELTLVGPLELALVEIGSCDALFQLGHREL